MGPEKKCACGQPLHYKDPAVQAYVERLIERQGEYVEVLDADGNWYKVPRHYLALHGFPIGKISTLGFEIAPSIVCPFCFRRSFNPTDIKEEYCGYCHKFHFQDPPIQ